MKKIIPFLWFDKEAGEAAKLYTSILKNSKIKYLTSLSDTPSGTVEIVTVELVGQEFTLMSAGPHFKFNPSVSFLIACKTKREVEETWKKFSDGATVLMDIASYPFSERYGWLQDKYGLSWQIMFMCKHKIKQKIIPTMMFVGDVSGKAEDAVKFYVSVFKNSKVESILRYGKGEEPNREGTIKHAAFTLAGEEFAAMDSALEHNFAFNEAISFVVNCNTQKEIDYYWENLSFDPKAEQCGWLKDKYGLSWQIVPNLLEKMLRDKDKTKISRVTEAFLKMKKFDIDVIKQAYTGK